MSKISNIALFAQRFNTLDHMLPMAIYIKNNFEINVKIILMSTNLVMLFKNHKNEHALLAKRYNIEIENFYELFIKKNSYRKFLNLLPAATFSRKILDSIERQILKRNLSPEIVKNDLLVFDFFQKGDLPKLLQVIRNKAENANVSTSSYTHGLLTTFDNTHHEHWDLEKFDYCLSDGELCSRLRKKGGIKEETIFEIGSFRYSTWYLEQIKSSNTLKDKHAHKYEIVVFLDPPQSKENISLMRESISNLLKNNIQLLIKPHTGSNSYNFLGKEFLNNPNISLALKDNTSSLIEKYHYFAVFGSSVGIEVLMRNKVLFWADLTSIPQFGKTVYNLLPEVNCFSNEDFIFNKNDKEIPEDQKEYKTTAKEIIRLTTSESESFNRNKKIIYFFNELTSKL